MPEDYAYQNLKDAIAEIPDFPKKGVLFRDVTPLLNQKFRETIDAMLGLFTQLELNGIDSFAGIDARGFIFASALASRAGKNFVMIRKGGKLPPPTISRNFSLEYGEDSIEMKSGTGGVAIIDDVLATGGTMHAAADLCLEAGYEVKAFATLINLAFLNDFSWNGMKTRSVFEYAE